MHNIYWATHVGTEFKQRFLPLKQIKEVHDYCAFSYYFAHCRSQSQLSYLLQSPLSAWLSTPLVSITYWSQQCTSFARHLTKSKTSRLETPVQVCSFYALHYTEFLIKQCRMHVRHYCPPVTMYSCHFHLQFEGAGFGSPLYNRVLVGCWTNCYVHLCLHLLPKKWLQNTKP